MNRTVRWIGVGVVFVLCFGAVGSWAQQQPVAAEPQAPSRTAQAPSELVPTLPVPRLVKFAGTFKDGQGQPRTGLVGITFAIYKEQEGGAALWVETQNVEPDEQGHYSVLLGATKSVGLPLELFSSGEPRWLGVQVNLPKELEQPRVLLVSVPYSLKAADADTLGGMPASAFVLAAPSSTASGAGVSGSTTPASGNSKTAGKTAASGTGKTAAPLAPVAANFIPVFLDNAGTLGSSVMAQSGSFIGVGTTTPAAALHVNGDTLLVTSATTAQVQFAGALSEARFGQDGSGAFFASDTPGKAVRFYTNNGTLNEGLRIDSSSNVGIGTQTPAAKLDVNGNQSISGNLTLPSSGTATAGGGFSSGAVSLAASSFNSGIGVPVSQTFQWQARPVGNNTSNASGQLSLLYGSGTNAPAATGLSLASNGVVTAPSFAGSGASLTNVNAATLGGMAPSAFATVGTSNTFSGAQTVSGNLTVGGGGVISGNGAGLTNLNAGNLTGTVAAATGGTGLTAAGAAGSFLRSNGSMWTSSALQAGDLPSGSSTYIQNSPGTAQAANLNITGSALVGLLTVTDTNANITPAIIKAAPSQTADIEEWQDSSGHVLGKVTPTGILQAPTGMIFYHASFQGASTLSVFGSGLISVSDGFATLSSGTTANSNAIIQETSPSSNFPVSGLDRTGAFLSARAVWNGNIVGSSSFEVFAGDDSNGFGFVAVGSSLDFFAQSGGGGGVIANFGITLSSNTPVNLLAVRRSSSIEFYVNGGLAGSISVASALPSSSSSSYTVRVANGGTAANAAVLVGGLTVGIPMF